MTFTNDKTDERIIFGCIEREKHNKKVDDSVKNSLMYLFLYPCLFIFFSLIIDIIFSAWIGLGLFAKYFLIDFSVILLLAGKIFIIPNKKAKITFMLIFLIIPIILNCVNACMYKTFGDIFYLDLISLISEATTVLSLDLFDIPCILINLSLLSVIIISVVLLSKKISNITITKKQNFSIIMVFFLFFEAIGLSFLVVTKNNLTDVDASCETYIADSDAYLYDTLSLKMKSYQSFGLYGFYSKEIYNSVSELFYNGPDDDEYQELMAFLDEGKTTTNKNAMLYGDNLVVIMCESLEWFAIDPIYTPNLYKFFYGDNSGDEIDTHTIRFSNYYSKHKTNVSESIGITGLMPNTISYTQCINNNGLNLPYSLPNLFKNDGATSANYFHSYTKYFYDRDTTNIAIGFDNVYGIEDVMDNLEEKDNYTKWHHFCADNKFLEQVIDKVAPTDERFMSFYTTVKTHGDYKDEFEHLTEEFKLLENKEMFNKFLNYFSTTGYILPDENSEEYEMFINYKAAAIDLDETLALLLNHLEINNLLDSTTIVMYADHNAYMDGLSYVMKGISIDDITYNSIAYKVPCAIYSNHFDKDFIAGNCVDQKIDVYTNVYDLYPTLCELFGLPFNKNLIQGYNIFSSEIENSLTISYICGIFTDKIYTRDLQNFYSCDGEDLSDDYIYKVKVNSNKFYLKQEKIDMIYKYNLMKNYLVE